MCHLTNESKTVASRSNDNSNGEGFSELRFDVYVEGKAADYQRHFFTASFPDLSNAVVFNPPSLSDALFSHTVKDGINCGQMLSLPR